MAKRSALALGLLALALLAWLGLRALDADRGGSLSSEGTNVADGEAEPAVELVGAAVARSTADSDSVAPIATSEATGTTRTTARAEEELVTLDVRVASASTGQIRPERQVEAWIGPGNPAPGEASLVRCRTDADGRAHFEFLRESGTAIHLGARVAELGWTSDIERVFAPADGPWHFELELAQESGCVVRGLVFRGESERATAGIVTVTAESAEPPRPSNSSNPNVAIAGAPPLVAAREEPVSYPLAADGTFELRLGMGRSYRLRAQLPDGAYDEKRLAMRGSQPMVYTTLHAFPRGDLVGRLTDLAGRGLERFQVRVAREPSGKAGSVLPIDHGQHRTTGPDGEFEFLGLRRLPTSLSTTAPTSGPTRRSGFSSPARSWEIAADLVPGAGEPLTFRAPLARLSLSVVDNSGAPVEFDISAAEGDPLDSLRSRLSVKRAKEGVHGGWIRLHELQRSDTDGEHDRAEFLAEAGHSHRVRLEGWNHATLEREFYVPASGLDVEAELRVQSYGPLIDVSFALVDAAGSGLPVRTTWTVTRQRDGLAVSLDLGSRAGLSAETSLPLGSYWVRASYLADDRTGHPPQTEGTGSPQLIEFEGDNSRRARRLLAQYEVANSWTVSREIQLTEDGPRHFELRDVDRGPSETSVLSFGR